MKSLIQTTLLLGLGLFSLHPAHAAQEPDFLKPELAFRYSAEVISAETIRATWIVAEGYYLYRDKINFRIDDSSLQLGQARFPKPTEIKDDEYFGEMPVYRGRVDIDIPYTSSTPAKKIKFALKASSQGCADAGFCYPPQNHVASLVSLTSATAGSTALTDKPQQDEFLGAISKRLGLGGKTQGNEFLEPDQAYRYAATAEDANTLVALWEIADGYYLYRDKLNFKLIDADNTQLGNFTLPKGKPKFDEYFGDSEVYFHQVEIRLPIIRKTGGPQTLTLEAQFQGCAEAGLCYPLMTKTVDIKLPAGGATGVTAPSSASTLTTPPSAADGYVSEQNLLARSLLEKPLWISLLLFFGLGIGLAFTPCVFPMVPILSSIIVGQRQVTTRQAFSLSSAYVLAMACTYTVVGIIAGLSGQNLQAAFQNPWVLGVFSAVFIALAMSMFGFYNLQIPSSWQSKLTNYSNSQKGGTLAGAAVMGLLSALIVGPCVAAPLAGALIVIGQTGDPWLGGAALFSLSLGMGTPLLVVGASAGKWLPKASGWMNTIKSIFGVLLLALAIWMLSRIIPGQVSMALWGALLIVSAVYMGAFERLTPEASGWSRLWKGAGIVIFIFGGLLEIGAAGGGTDPLQPLRSISFAGATKASDQAELPFVTFKGLERLERELAAASAAGKPVMVDFYADWCVSCKELERYTFSDPAVQRELRNAILLRADVTANDEADQALLRKFGIFGPPTILFFGTDQKERRDFRVIGYIGPEEFAPLARAALRG